MFLAVFSGFLAIMERFSSTVCFKSEDGKFDCESVQGGEYGRILGVKTSQAGPFAFLILLISYIYGNVKGKYKDNFIEAYYLFVVLGTLFALYFLYVQFFILKQFCSTCLIIDFTVILVGILSYIQYRRR